MTSVVLPIPRWQAADGCSDGVASAEMMRPEMRPQVLFEQLPEW
jgi:hypothetical protein